MARPARAEKAARLIRRGVVLAMVPGAALWLGGCSSLPNAVNPVAWYRDLTGLSKNDSEGAGFNQKNLEQGNKEPYPNLASVPPPPSRALSASERAALEKSLVADRQNAHYNEEQLEAGAPVPGAAAPPAPAPLSQALASPSSSNASSPATTAGPTPAASAPALGAAAEPPAPPARTPSAQPQAAAKRPAPVERGSEAPPAESSLVSPSVRSIPPGETPAASPPAPRVATASPSASSAGVIAAPPPPAPPPPAPEIAVTAPPPLPTAAARKGPPLVSQPAADIAFAPGSTKLGEGENGQLADVAGLYKEGGGKLRVVGYAERVSGKDAAQQELKSFGMALDRAKAVAVALTRLGVPAKDISVEAAPVGDTGAQAPHAEIFVER